MATESEFIDSLFNTQQNPSDEGTSRTDGDDVATLLPILSAMDKTLDEIAANTSILSTLKFWQKTAIKIQQKSLATVKTKKTADFLASGGTQTTAKPGTHTTSTHNKINVATAQQKDRQTATKTTAQRTGANHKNSAEAALLSPSRNAKNQAGKEASAATPLLTAADAISEASENIAKQTSLAVRQSKKNAEGQKAKTKSSEALEKNENKNDAKGQESLGLLGDIKNRLKDWNGDFLGDGHEKELEDAVGYGVGGPLYGAMKEVKGAIDDIDIDDNSLAGTIKNAIADKVGITAAKDKITETKENLKSGVMKWAGIDSLNEKKNTGNRDEHGRFIRGGGKQHEQSPVAEPTQDTKKKNIISERDPLGEAINAQTETEQDSLNLQEKESKNADKRHKQILRALGSLDGLGGLGNLGGGLFKKGGGLLKKAGGGVGKILGKIGGKAAGLLGLGAVGAGTLAAGAGTAATAATTAATTGAAIAGDAGAVAGKAGATAAEKAGGKGLAKVGAKVGTKAAGRAAYAIPVVGQVLAAGMTAYDAISGFNDKELHQQAFGLQEGQEATLGQKISSSLANVVDMGGVFTGLAGLFGADVNTADIAKGIYGFFGGDNEAKAEAAKPEEPQLKTRQSVDQMEDWMFDKQETAEAAQEKPKAATALQGKDETPSLLETIGETAQKIFESITDFFKNSDTVQQLQGVLGEFGSSISNGVSGAMTALGSSVSTITGGGGGKPATAQLKGDTSQVMSASLAMGTQDAVNRGVRYKFGSKNSKTGGIDCSGWVTENTLAMFDNVNKAAGKEVFGKDARKAIKDGGGAAGIIQSVSEKTGVQLTNADITPDKIKAGMMIGMDTGNHGWDAGRYKGIDHIVQTYQDPETGQIMVSESSGKKGVHATPYEEWYKKWGKKANLYATDVTQLANKDALQPVEGQKPAEGENAAPPVMVAANTETAKAQTPETVGKLTTPPTVAPTPANPLPSTQNSDQQKQQALKEITPAVQQVMTANATDTTNIEKLLMQILAAVEKNGKNDGGSANNPQSIAFTFNDPALNRMAAM